MQRRNRLPEVGLHQKKAKHHNLPPESLEGAIPERLEGRIFGNTEESLIPPHALMTIFRLSECDE